MSVHFKDQNPTKQEELERKTDTGGIIWASELERTTESPNHFQFPGLCLVLGHLEIAAGQ